MKKLFFLIVFLVVVTVSEACQCPVTILNEKEIAKYELIFKGKIKSVKLSEGANSEAVFQVEELYKGNSTPEFKVLFDKLDECKIDLNAGEEWIIYTNYIQIDKAKLDFCSRSRKYIKNIKEDFYAVTTGISYDEELRYLQTSLGLHKLLKENLNKVENRNQIPTQTEFIYILIFSILGIILFYWLIRKFLK